MGIFDLFSKRPFRIRPSQIPAFLDQITRAVTGKAPVGSRGEKYDFGEKLVRFNVFELFNLQYSITRYILLKEKVNLAVINEFDKKIIEALREKIEEFLDPLSEEHQTDNIDKLLKILKSELDERYLLYSANFETLQKIKCFYHKLDQNERLYRFIYNNILSFKFVNLSEEEIEDWFRSNIKELEVIRTLILWFFEVIYILIVPFDTFYFEE